MSEFFRALELARQEQEQRAEAARRGRPADGPGPAEPSPVPVGEAAGPAAATEPRPASAVGLEVLDGVDERLVTLLSPKGFAAEQYQTLRYFVERRRAPGEPAVVAVSSPGSREGKTATVINLGGALAQSPDTAVLIVDCDLRRSAVTKQLGLTGIQRPGLADAITTGLPLDEVVIALPMFNLSVIAAGGPTAAPYELFKSPRFREFLAAVRARFDYILLDTPPVLAAPDCRVLAEHVDGLLLVVAAHRTPVKALGEALAALEPDKVIGLVYNADDGLVVARSYFGYEPDGHDGPSPPRRVWPRTRTRGGAGEPATAGGRRWR
jgi:capsular exopolysaccharide synthesis family protein